jgi:hypothetical protein
MGNGNRKWYSTGNSPAPLLTPVRSLDYDLRLADN